MALKGRNAIVIAPSPAGLATTTRTVGLMRAELEKVGAPADLVQVLPPPVDKPLTNALMAACDLVVVTGSQNNVRNAYRSGTPAIGVGAGNVPVIIDSSAKLDEAAEKIRMSKCFDNATSCSSENSVLIVDDVYDDAIAALERAGGYLADKAEKDAIRDTLWVNGKLNRKVIAKDPAVFAAECGLDRRSARLEVLHGRGDRGRPRAIPFSDEKLALVLTVYRVKNFDNADGQGPCDHGVQGEGTLRRHPHPRKWHTPADSPRSSKPHASW